MYTLLVLSACLALAFSVPVNHHPDNQPNEPHHPPEGHVTNEPHGTHEPHPTNEPHATHEPQATHAPDVQHTFSEKNATFLQDLPNMVMVLRTESGCYVTHLHSDEVKNIDDLEFLLKLEGEILHHLKTAHHFQMAHNPDQYSDEVKSACPKLYAYHKEH